MGGLIIFLVAVIALVILDAIALSHGVDSRPDFEDPRAPAAGLYT